MPDPLHPLDAGEGPRPPRTLRRTIAAVTSLIAAVALVVCAALILFTTELSVSTRTLGDSVESIRHAEEAEISLLLHARAEDALVRNDLAGGLQRRLLEARRFVSTHGEQKILDRAESDVAAYLHRVSGGSTAEEHVVDRSLEAAHVALERLVDVNVEQARAARVEADRWDRVANVVAVALAAVIMSVALLLLWWLRRRAFRPILDLLAALDGFRTDRDVRARESGPTEFRQLARGFNHMADALGRREKDKQAFLAGVAHDLRSPLQALHLAVGQVDPAEPLPPEPRTRQLFGMVSRQLVRIERMLDDLLDTACAEAGRLEIRTQPSDVRDLVRDVAEIFEVASPGHRLELVLPADISLVDCDPGRMTQVLINLIQNAIKYSPDGGAIRVQIENGSREVTISVADQGVGIPYEEQHAVFEPYQRSSGTRTAIAGSGLGLFVVRHIVEAHGGRIDVSSSPAVGSTFRVRLPARVENQLGAQ
ncbi:MAG TPA: HAMP domain-containing sensor histidine kinase [Kofleriaceae bacterium]|nr:HAMP domain-containing sensor histidine kinase [Kofleriaceae bacterium]